MEDLAQANPDFIKLTDMGKSHEGRKILMLKVGTSPRAPTPGQSGWTAVSMLGTVNHLVFSSALYF